MLLRCRYSAISGGQIANALACLTGGECSRRGLTTWDATQSWEKLAEQVASDEWFVGAGSQQPVTTTTTAPTEAAAKTLQQEQERRLRGIVTGHAYTILRTYQSPAIPVADDSKGEGGDAEGEGEPLRLVELRNPWGHGEWKGDWCPGSRCWTATAQGRAAAAALDVVDSSSGGATGTMNIIVK